MRPFEQQLQTDWPTARWRDLTVLVAVSGGADSVALLRALVAVARSDRGECAVENDRSRGAGAPVGWLVVAHYHHGLRGAEAEADLEFVVDLCKRLGVECVLGRAEKSDSLAPESNDFFSDPKPQTSNLKPGSSEETSRDARYKFLIATAKQFGARYVALAHTADDQAETVLHHVLRGTGLSGLAGMPRARALADGIALVRPLLGVRRAAAREYLRELGQSFREDSSNADGAYTRNRLRNELLPKLAADYNSQIVESLLRLGALAGDAQELIAAQAAELAERTGAKREPGQLTFCVARLTAAPKHLVREMLIAAWRDQGWPMGAMGHAEWTDLAEMATAASPRKRVFPGEVIAERTTETLTLRRRRLVA